MIFFNETLLYKTGNDFAEVASRMGAWAYLAHIIVKAFIKGVLYMDILRWRAALEGSDNNNHLRLHLTGINSIIAPNCLIIVG